MEKAKILIVEDEAIIAMEIESQLQSLGYEVTSIVDTGIKAIKKAEEDKPDLMLMDIRIKGEMDGIEAAEVIRNRFGIPVIFSTAYLDKKRIERAKITMPFGYVLKPIQERDLKVTIEMALYVLKVDLERRKVESLNRMLMDSLPHPAMLIKKNRTVLASNKVAQELGVTVGSKCWKTFGKALYIQDEDKQLIKDGKEPINPQCHFCLADKSIAENCLMNDPNVTTSGVFDTYWVHVKDDIYLHYSVDITERKQAEQELSKVNEDLHIHQVELEQQNEELRESQLQITELQNKYFDLYEMAPVGYITFNDKKLITEANLTSCTMLGTEKSVLKGLGFSNFIDVESQDDFYLHRRQVVETKTQQTCDLTLVRKDKSKFLARLESKAVFDDKGEFIQLNTNIIDIGKQQ
jgi:CheY-like chemotaxis protein